MMKDPLSAVSVKSIDGKTYWLRDKPARTEEAAKRRIQTSGNSLDVSEPDVALLNIGLRQSLRVRNLSHPSWPTFLVQNGNAVRYQYGPCDQLQVPS